MDEKIFLVEEIKDINLEIGAANLFLQRAENQDELKVILAKGEMAHFHVTKQENQLEMSYKKPSQAHCVRQLPRRGSF